LVRRKLCVENKYRPGLLKPVDFGYINTTSLVEKGLNPGICPTSTLHQIAVIPDSGTSF
jgi:hypothetical protein